MLLLLTPAWQKAKATVVQWTRPPSLRERALSQPSVDVTQRLGLGGVREMVSDNGKVRQALVAAGIVRRL